MAQPEDLKDLGDKKNKEETSPAIREVSKELERFSKTEEDAMTKERTKSDEAAGQEAEKRNTQAEKDQQQAEAARGFLNRVFGLKKVPEIIKTNPEDVLREEAAREGNSRDWEKIHNRIELERKEKAERYERFDKQEAEYRDKKAEADLKLKQEATEETKRRAEEDKKEEENVRRLEGMKAEFKPGDYVELTSEAKIIFKKERPEDYDSLVASGTQIFVRGIDETGKFSIECQTRIGKLKIFHVELKDLTRAEKIDPKYADGLYRDN